MGPQRPQRGLGQRDLAIGALDALEDGALVEALLREPAGGGPEAGRPPGVVEERVGTSRSVTPSAAAPRQPRIRVAMTARAMADASTGVRARPRPRLLVRPSYAGRPPI